MTQPYLGLYCIVRDATETIDALLDSVLKTPESDVTGHMYTDAAFDEYVFVDTGSVDDTREKIVAALARSGAGDIAFPDGDGAATYEFKGVRVVLARFTWVFDFSAARNYSFSLGTAKWRAYLDSDDQFPDACRIREELKDTEARNGDVNTISMKYDYAPDVVQDTARIFRWADGWEWVMPLHERCARKPEHLPRNISQWPMMTVHHRPPVGHGAAALERNIKYAETAYNAAHAAGDGQAAGINAYHLGFYAHALGRVDMARDYLREALGVLKHTNLGGLAYVELARLEIEEKNWDAAISAGGAAFANAPEMSEGLGVMAVAYHLKGDNVRACELFDAWRARGKPILHTAYDRVLNDVFFPAHAVMAYLARERSADAAAMLGWIDQQPDEVRGNPQVRVLVANARATVLLSSGLDRVKALWEFLLWDTEALKAWTLLEQVVPAALSDHPAIGALRDHLVTKLPHILDGWEGYKKAYASIPAETYHTGEAQKSFVADLGRAKAIKAWAEALPKEGPPVRICSVGLQDGYMEAAVLTANSRTVLTVCDVAPQASEGIRRLVEQFPGRVITHDVKTGHYDWPEGPFELVIMFEVLEHLPDDLEALWKLRTMLAPGGQIYLSTPVASRWVEQYLTTERGPDFYGHVRAHNPTTLWRQIQRAGLTGSLEATDNGGIFLARLSAGAMTRTTRMSRGERTVFYGARGRPPQRRIAIFAPGGMPFDAKSLDEGHVGGSEEAVVHLAARLSVQFHYQVDVYAPMPLRDPALHAADGVLWRRTEEFDAASRKYDAVLLWRAPQLLLSPLVGRAPYKKILWLHDEFYGAPVEAYKKADAVIVLSRAHEQAIARRDGFEGPFSHAGNGIDVASLPAVYPGKRDPYKLIYASSPDRGLEYLLDLWPQIKALDKRVTLDVYYDWTGLRSKYPAWAGRLQEKLKQSGITFYGGVGHKQLHAAYRAAGIWAYPTGFAEISCISAMKAQALGCWPVTTTMAALDETVRHGIKIAPPDWSLDSGIITGKLDAGTHADFKARYLEALGRALEDDAVTEEQRIKMAEDARARFDWGIVAYGFDTIIQKVV